MLKLKPISMLLPLMLMLALTNAYAASAEPLNRNSETKILGSSDDETNENLTLYYSGEKYCKVNSTGKFIVPCLYDHISLFEEGLALVVLDNKFGYVDTEGREVISPIFDDAQDFSEKLAVVAVNQTYGFIDRYGKIVIPLKFDKAQSFSEGLAAIKVEGKWGFINSHGQLAISPVFDEVSSFKGGFALVNIQKDCDLYYIDNTGSRTTKSINVPGAFFASETINECQMY